MASHLSLHKVKSATASTSHAVTGAFTIDFATDDPYSVHSVTVFSDDAVLAARLVEAINRISRDRATELAEASRAEAA